MFYQKSSHFPIHSILDDLKKAFHQQNKLLLIAPPGAGKTTIIPLSLLKELPLDQKIIVLEPRRLAAQNAALFMAELYQENIGHTIGYKVRFDQKCSAQSRIIVMSEGVFCNFLIENPELKDIAYVIFDEFHERNLEADFALALLLDVQEALRDDLKLLFMSATLNYQELQKKLEKIAQSPIKFIESHGQTYPLEIRYVPIEPNQNLFDHMANVILNMLISEQGGILAFLPGQKEIYAVQKILQQKLSPFLQQQCEILPLYGALNREKQKRAIQKLPLVPNGKKRKIVLATSIAETSLTLENISIVIDSGLHKKALFDIKTGTTKLVTQKASLASIDQRAGRAARQKQGLAIRLWPIEQNAGLIPFDPPKILEKDLTDLVLKAFAFGVQNLKQLRLLDPPKQLSIDFAKDFLRNLKLIDNKDNLTKEGKDIQKLPFSPQLSLMILKARTKKTKYLAVLLALIISEKNLQKSTNIEDCLFWLQENQQKAKKWFNLAQNLSNNRNNDYDLNTINEILWPVFSDQIAMNRGKNGEFLTKKGHGIYLDLNEPLSRERFIFVLDTHGQSANKRVLLAAKCDEDRLFKQLQSHLQYEVNSPFCPKNKKFSIHKQIKFGALKLKKQDCSLDQLTIEEEITILKEALRQHGLKLLPFEGKALKLYQRLAWMQKHYPDYALDFSENTLIHDIELWLWPFLKSLKNFTKFTESMLYQALYHRMDYNDQQNFEKAAPLYYKTKQGKLIEIDYQSLEKTPLLRARVQEFYSETTQPKFFSPYALEPIMLKLELLSPALRPIQITQNLSLFWQGSWLDIRKDMKNRYPKHHWPQEPNKNPKKIIEK